MKANVIEATVELTDEGVWVYPSNPADLGAYGKGETLQEAKKSFIEALELQKEASDGYEPNEILLSDYEIEYTIDVENFLDVFSPIMPKAGLSRITGINAKQLWAYQHGQTKPRKEQVEKIQDAMHNFANELLSLQLKVAR